MIFRARDAARPVGRHARGSAQRRGPEFRPLPATLASRGPRVRVTLELADGSSLSLPADSAAARELAALAEALGTS